MFLRVGLPYLDSWCKYESSRRQNSSIHTFKDLDKPLDYYSRQHWGKALYKLNNQEGDGFGSYDPASIL